MIISKDLPKSVLIGRGSGGVKRYLRDQYVNQSSKILRYIQEIDHVYYKKCLFIIYKQFLLIFLKVLLDIAEAIARHYPLAKLEISKRGSQWLSKNRMQQAEDEVSVY